MMRQLGTFLIAAAIAAAGVGANGAEGGASQSGAPAAPAMRQGAEATADAVQDGKGMAAIRHAAKAKTYLFVFFYKEEDRQTRAMRAVFDATMKRFATRAESVAVDITDTAEKTIVKKIEVSRAPMPLVVAMAPNGVITRGFPVEFDEKQLLEAFVSPTMEKCLKALQDGKNIFVCVQNADTAKNEAAMKGVRGFAADAAQAKNTEVFPLDPKDPAEAMFLKQFDIDPKTPVAVTLFLTSPAKIIGTYKGATDKDQLAKALADCKAQCKGAT